jgi:hypothetical protein
MTSERDVHDSIRSHDAYRETHMTSTIDFAEGSHVFE